MIMKSTAKCGFNIIINCNVMFLLVTDFATPIWHRHYRPVDFMVGDSNSIKTRLSFLPDLNSLGLYNFGDYG